MNKKVSFEDIQKKFIDPSSESAVADDENIGATAEAVDESYFKFDTNDPAAILIAGSSDGACSAPGSMPGSAKASAAGSAGGGPSGDGACASGAGGASSCDSGSAGSGSGAGGGS